MNELREAGVKILADGCRALRSRPTLVDLAGPVALVIGNEGNGVPDDLAAKADGTITIPCPGPVESLNAAVAASVLLYEAARQRALARASLRQPATLLQKAAPRSGRERAMSLFDSEPTVHSSPPKSLPHAERRRWRSGCGRAAWTNWWARSIWSVPASRLRVQIERDDASSMIFWGPPGVGKTTLAKIIAETTKATFIEFSAVTSGIKEIKQVMADAAKAAELHSRTILFVDEIHRFNKAQQDAFLPYVERGTIRLIGATTENPSFEIISALLSRCRVYVLEPLKEEQIVDAAAARARRPRNAAWARWS